MKAIKIVCLSIFSCIGFLFAENYLIEGGQESKIQYRLIQSVHPPNSVRSLTLSYVIPESFTSPTYSQRIENFQMIFSTPPDQKEEKRDIRGNPVLKAVWESPPPSLKVTMAFYAFNKTSLEPLDSHALYPLGSLPSEILVYLKATSQVQSDHPEIQTQAKALIQGVKTEFDAVQRILSWVVDHVRYVSPSSQYDALYTLHTGKGNCQNFSHLACAFLRAVGIPTRIVNGVTLNQPYSVKTREGEFSFRFGQGRHSWIEVYFPDLEWVPFDPQQTELFVSNRFIRIEVGMDNAETIQDGLIRWKESKNSRTQMAFEEHIEADFESDRVQLAMEKQNYGPQNMLLCPPVRASFQPILPVPPPSPPVSPIPVERLMYTEPCLFGNLDFPRRVNFLMTRGPAQKAGEDQFQMQKNFLVETAEYVTTQLRQYAQVFIVEKPLKLCKVGLALHLFGGDGQLWIELFHDRNGKPGKLIATSDFFNTNQLFKTQGYDWIDFSFDSNPPILAPGKYWIALGFTGSPIVNWFYTYGKPVGPVDGTRYKGVYDADWSGALAYEFNYRIMGYIPKEE